MITDVRILIELCSNELSDRGYQTQLVNRYKAHWNQLAEWMKARQISEFSKDMADRYLDENIGTHLLRHGMDRQDRYHLRAIRMLVSYQRDGDFESFKKRIAEPAGRDMIFSKGRDDSRGVTAHDLASLLMKKPGCITPTKVIPQERR